MPRPGSSNTYQLVYTFNKDVTVAGTATKTQGTATVGVPTIGPDPNQVTVSLTGVANAQHLVVNLSGVQDCIGEVADNQMARIDVLLGDVNGNGVVSNTDVAAVKGQVSAPVSDSNFRADVNANGIVSNTDVATTKAQVSSSLR